MMVRRRQGKSNNLLHRALSEVFHNTPSTVERANVKGKKKRKMMIAIAFSKARKAGANLPRK